MITRFILSLTATLLFGKIIAQDAHFSMYQSAPTLMNPALTGLAPGAANHRLTTSYRSQWLKPFGQPAFHTAFVGYDVRYCPLPCDPGEVKLFGFGLNLMHDRSGVSPLQRSQALFQASYSQTIGTDLLLAAGGEFGGVFHSLGGGDLYFDEQFVGGVYDKNVPGEEFDKNSFVVEDLGAGVALYTAGCGSNRNGFSIGGSFKHLTQPSYRFFDQNDEVSASLPMRINVHGRAHLLLKKGISATDVRVLFMDQGVYRQYLVGVDGIWYLKNRQSHLFNLAGGLAWRRAQYLEIGWHSDALIATLSFDMDAMRLSMSYDLSLSELYPKQNRGAFELAMQFFWGSNSDCRIECPMGL